MIKKKNPSFLASSLKLNATQIKSLGLGGYDKNAVRDPSLVPSRSFFESKVNSMPVMQCTRPRALDFLAVKSVGCPT